MAIYIRVSTKRQIDKYSPGEQKRILTEYAASRDWIIHDYYSDLGESGADSDREDLDRLLIDAEKKLFDKVLLFEQDRLSRLEQIDWAYLANSLARLNIKLITPTSEINLENEEDRFMADLFNLLANRELKKIKKRTSMGRRAANRDGVYFCGHVPYGTSLDRETQIWSVIPKERDVVQSIFEWYSSSVGFHEISHRLNRLGYRTRHGGKWYFATVGKLIRNPVYMGEFRQTVLGETSHHEIKWANGDKPIISVETWKNAQLIMADRAKQYFHGKKHLLISILVCAECGAKLRVKGNKKNTYYLHRDEKSPCNKRFQKLKLEKLVIGELKNLATNTEYLQQLLAQESKPENTHALESNLTQCVLERKKAIDKKGRLLDLFLEGSWTKEELNGQKEKLELELVSLSKREDELKNRLAASKQQVTDIEKISVALRIFQDFDIILTYGEQFKLIREVIEKITIDKIGNLDIKLKVNNDDGCSQSVAHIQIYN